MLVIYLVTLALSSGLAGLMVSQVLGSYGYVHGLHMTGMVAGAAAGLFASLQLLYMAALRLLFPTRSRVPLIGEALSQLTALSLTPYLVHLSIPWPHPALQKVELFVFLGVFAASHGFFKLVSFYAAVRGEPSSRVASLAWLMCSAVCMGSAALLTTTWMRTTEKAQPQAPSETASYRIGGQYATARLSPEGAAIPVEWTHRPGTALSLMLAYPPEAKPVQNTDSDADDEKSGRVYVTVAFDKKHSTSVSESLLPDGWTEIRIPADQIPENVTKALVYWESRKPPVWERFLNIRPASRTNERLLVAGPYVREERSQATAPNFLIVVIEGLGAQHVSGLGYKRATTPALDRLAHNALVFSNAYTPSPDISAASMTVLTGVNPLRHGFLGKHAGPLPASIHTIAEALESRGYATAAFTEGETPETHDLATGTGFERGFQLFDSTTPSADADCGPTLDKVQAWISAHAAVKYGVFIRLRELRRLQWHERYAPGFAVNADNPTPLETFDSAVAYVDRQLGELIQAVRSSESGKRTVTIVTSSYGPDFSAGSEVSPAIGLSELSLRVPLWLQGPDIKKVERPDAIGLEDIAPTVLALMGGNSLPEGRLDGANLLPSPLDKSPISMLGDPLALSIRFDRWRMTWQSGRSAFETSGRGTDSIVGLYDVLVARKQGAAPDMASKHPDLTARLRARLDDYCR